MNAAGCLLAFVDEQTMAIRCATRSLLSILTAALIGLTSLGCGDDGKKLEPPTDRVDAPTDPAKEAKAPEIKLPDAKKK